MIPQALINIFSKPEPKPFLTQAEIQSLIAKNKEDLTSLNVSRGRVKLYIKEAWEKADKDTAEGQEAFKNLNYLKNIQRCIKDEYATMSRIQAKLKKASKVV